MLIRDVFSTTIEERIEAVVKVVDRKPVTIYNELSNLVVTPQWEKLLLTMLDVYTEHFDDDDYQSIGIWISGFFGSGKSLLLKTLGLLLQGGTLNMPTNPAIHQLFLNRLPADSQYRSDIERALVICQARLSTSLIGGNLHAQLANINESLALIVFKLFATERGYTNNWAFAWTFEYQLDILGLTEEFRRRVCERCGEDWEEVVDDSGIYSEALNTVVMELFPTRFTDITSVRDAMSRTYYNGITPEALVKRMCDWAKSQDRGSRRHKVLVQLDELGQWLSGAPTRAMEVQVLAETASAFGEGRLWIAVTAHGDVQALRSNVQQEIYAKINQRFDTQCRLSNEDIYKVVQTRLLHKNQPAYTLLRQRFDERSGTLIEMGTLQGSRRVYPIPTADLFADFYPYLPWTVNIIPNIIRCIAQSAGKNEALTGSNRTMMSVVQLGVLETPQLLTAEVGKLICLADLYPHLSTDAPSETRTDINRITANVKGATQELTVRVAYALYLLGQDEFIPCTLTNITLALVDTLDVDLHALREQVKQELELLALHGYVKQVGDLYAFLSTQQRSFQDKVKQRELELLEKNYELSLKLKEGYEGYNALRFEDVTVGTTGLKKQVKIELDGKIINRTQGNVTVRVYSPLQYVLDEEIENDTILKQRSNQELDTIYLRMGKSPNLRRALVRAVATSEIADEVQALSGSNDPEYEVARQAKQNDLTEYRQDVYRALDESIRSGMIFMRGTSYNLMEGSNAAEMMRKTLGMLLLIIYSRLSDLPYRVQNEESAVRAALYDNKVHPDLKALNVYNADGSLNMSSALLSSLKGRLPLENSDQGPKLADALRADFERPPFGWDGNVVKVGLALLLRASQCRLIDGRITLTEPQNPEVLLALTKVVRFRALRVQGLRSNLENKDLQAIRGQYTQIFPLSPRLPLIEQTMHKLLGEELGKLHEQASTLRDWFAAVQCPLPTTFESGDSVVFDLLNGAVSTVRLPLFQNNAAVLLTYVMLLQDLERFKAEHGTTFSQVRDFYNRMTNVDNVPIAVNAFLADWRTVVTVNKEVSNTERWNDLLQAYHTAQQALNDQIVQWQQEIVQGTRLLEGQLTDQLAQAGVPVEQLPAETTLLVREIQDIRAQSEGTSLNFSEIIRLRSRFNNMQISLPVRILEVGRRYQPLLPSHTERPIPPVEATAAPVPTAATDLDQDAHLSWQRDLGRVRISSLEDLDQLLERLKGLVNSKLEQSHIVVID